MERFCISQQEGELSRDSARDPMEEWHSLSSGKVMMFVPCSTFLHGSSILKITFTLNYNSYMDLHRKSPCPLAA